jgi:hypothetical protein
MLSLRPHVTLTRVVTRKVGDVNRISAARYITTLKSRSILSTSRPQIHILARERTQQIINRLERTYATMSNNQDLTMDQVVLLYIVLD